MDEPSLNRISRRSLKFLHVLFLKADCFFSKPMSEEVERLCPQHALCWSQGKVHKLKQPGLPGWMWTNRSFSSPPRGSFLSQASSRRGSGSFIILNGIFRSA
ncbi:hypothetical protein PoB_005568500 [Plakobranchus ocellatus]|uniref:Uncharacterized protein n=1 Tax=Plakobranchus ocellatus TaxID=259542 RepID=A0AAV4CBY8_9GAST|nr:hypothetical protein PoB_005568500 [Plakobranchus ocellatus]